MSEQTSISWTDATFNPWIGCTKVSPGCDGCYAESWSKRAGDKVGKWGPGAPRVRTTPANWRQPLKWNAEPFLACSTCRWRGDSKAAHMEIPSGDAVCPRCAGDLQPARRRVFCASLADVFDNEVPKEWRRDLFQLIADTPHLDWLLLTKRIGNATRMMDEIAWMPRGPGCWQPMPNVWLGATIVNQEEADRDIPKLLATPARVRFLSMEPLLGPVEFSNVTRRSDAVAQLGKPALSGIHWVITGGESGPGARPYAVEWARSIVAQCEAAGVAVHVKQLGAHVITTGISGPGQHWPRETGLHDTGLGHFRKHLVDRAGGDTAEWPEDLRVQEFPA